MKSYLKEISFLLNVSKVQISIFVLYFILLSTLDLLGIGIIGYSITLAVNPEEINGILGWGVDDLNHTLAILGGFLFIAFSSKAFLGVWINKIVFNFATEQTIFLRSKLMKAYQLMPYEEYLKRSSSEYINIIFGFTQQYANQALVPLLRSIGDIFVAVSIIIFLSFSDLFVLSVLVGLIILTVVAYDILIRDKATYYGHMANTLSESIFRSISEGIKGFKEVRVLGKEEYFHQNLKAASIEHSYNYVQSQVLAIIPRYFSELLLVVFFMLVVFKSIAFGENLSLLLPTIGVFAAASVRLIPISNLISATLVSLRVARHGVSVMYGDLILYSEIDNSRVDSSHMDEDFKYLELSNVSFAYNGSKYSALKDVSLKIKRGEVIGVIGESGSGKTTLIDVLLGLLKNQEGKILYNGKPLDFSSKRWSSKIGYLPQDIFIIEDTLLSNISLLKSCDYKKSNSLDNVLKSVDQAKLSKTIELLSDGLNTFLGENGVVLSGGQRQRVALARVFFHDREILIMDEATSALDNDTEGEVIKEIYQLKGKKTIIVIAHNLSTLKYCDRIYELKNGSLINCRSYDDLTNR